MALWEPTCSVPEHEHTCSPKNCFGGMPPRRELGPPAPTPGAWPPGAASSPPRSKQDREREARMDRAQEALLAEAAERSPQRVREASELQQILAASGRLAPDGSCRLRVAQWPGDGTADADEIEIDRVCDAAQRVWGEERALPHWDDEEVPGSPTYKRGAPQPKPEKAASPQRGKPGKRVDPQPPRHVGPNSTKGALLTDPNATVAVLATPPWFLTQGATSAEETSIEPAWREYVGDFERPVQPRAWNPPVPPPRALPPPPAAFAAADAAVKRRPSTAEQWPHASTTA